MVTKVFSTALSTVGLSLVLWGSVSPAVWAGDPFRSSNPKAIGNQTEAAFKALFKDGNYTEAKRLVQQAESSEANEPLLHALKASLAFNDGDLATFTAAGTATREKAQQLLATDPMRGNLYLAVGNFLEGAAIAKKDGLVRGAVPALGKVQEAFKSLDAAEKIDAQDPELNLIRGNIDLMLAVNVKMPLSDSNKAIQKLEAAAAPRYIADRSLAWGYRDLKQLDKAKVAIDRALDQAKNNPELQYLKAQVLVKQKDYPAAVTWFDKALKKKAQLPGPLAAQIERERGWANDKVSPAAAPSPGSAVQPTTSPSPAPSSNPVIK
jgi:tetratricopeptide (TPR) repeat protein